MRLLLLTFLLIISFVGQLYAQSGCQTPATVYTQSVGHESALAYWYSVNAATQYQLQWRSVGISSWTNSTVVSASQYTIPNLANNTTYEWRVRSICAAGDTSVFAATQVLRTVCAAPYYASVGSISYNGAYLAWSSPVYNVPYELQWRQANTIDWSTVNGVVSGGYSLTGLTTNTVYEWQVRTACSATAKSDYVQGVIFRPECTRITNPYTSDISYTRARLNWSASQSQFTVDVQWRKEGDTVWNVMAAVNTTVTTITGLANNTRYQWRVRATCTESIQSDFTAIQSFQTSCPTPSISLGSVMASSATLNLYSSEPFVTFTLRWRPTGEANWNTVTDLANQQYRLRNLTVNTTYEWQAQAVCTSTAQSTFVPGSTIQTRCSQPAYNMSYGNLKGTSVDVQWGNDEEDVRYDFRYRPVDTTEWLTIPGLSQTAYSLTGLTSGNTYEWQVQRVCSLTAATPVSGYVSGQRITAVCVAPTSLYATDITGARATLSWSGPSGPYDLQYRRIGDADWQTTTTMETGYKLEDLMPAMTYEWRVRNVCGAGITSAYVAGSSFTIPCATPFYVYATAQTRTSAHVVWGTGGIGRYDLQWRRLGQPDWVTISDVAETTWILENLAPGDTYEYRVRVRCSATTWSAYSNTNTFNTNCQQPTGLAVKPVTFALINLTWIANDPTVTYTVRFRERNVGNWGEFPGLTKGSLAMAGLTVGRDYEWQVKAVCGNALESAYTSGPVFPAVCPVVTYLYTSDITDTQTRLTWNRVVYQGVRYTVQWRVVGITAWNSIPNLTESSVLLTGLTNQGRYEFRVLTSCPTTDTPDPVASYVQGWQTNCASWLNTQVDDITATSARLYWSISNRPDVTEFEIQWRPQTSPAQPWNTVTNLTSNAYLLNDLVLGTAYEWRIRYRCSSGIYTDYQAGSYFTTNCPSVYSMNASPKATEVQLTWNAVYSDSYRQYELRWRTTDVPTWNSVPNLTTTSYSLTGLQPNTSYQWEIRALCTNGQYSSLAIYPFRTLPSCSAAVNSNTADPSETSAFMSWTSPGEATSYTVWWRPTTATTWQRMTGVTSTTLLLTNLLPRTTYSYSIQSDCPNVNTALQPAGLFTNSFTTNCQLPQGFVSNLVDRQTTSARFSFSRASYASPAPFDFQWRVAGTANWQTQTVTGNSFTLNGLSGQMVYEYRTRAICPNTAVPVTANQYLLTTLCPNNAINNTPTAQTGPTSARLWWGPNGTTYTYELQWRQSPTRSGGTDTWTTISSVTSETYLLGNLTPNTLYEFRVRSVCSGNTGSGFSAIIPFQTACTEPYALASLGITSTSATVQWNNELPGSLFDVQYRPIGTYNWTLVPGVQPPVSLTGLTHETTYEWLVQRNCGGNERSGLAEGNPFRTECRWLSNSIPLPSVQPGITTLALNISASPNRQYNTRYRVVGSSMWQQTGVVGTGFFSVTGLIGNTVYELETQLVCGADTRSAFVSLPVTRTLPDCSSLFTVQPGSWADPRVWSCNRVPISADSVRLLHSVQVPGLFGGAAKSVRFEPGGVLKVGVQAGVKVGE